MLIRLKPLSLALSGAAMLTLAACGGGSSTPEPVAPTPPPTTNVSMKVIDGAIRNALVCVDKNSNNACDADETQGRTDANGNVTLAVPDADVGRYRVIAVVGTDAVDADHGPVTTTFTMAAPSDQTAVISPLTTLVAQTAATQGLSTTAAAQMLQEMSGLPAMMGDYTQPGATGGAAAATVARTLVVTTQQQNTALASVVGTSAMGGSVITRAEVDSAIAGALTQLLPLMVAAASSTEVQTACAGGIAAPACATAIQTQVADIASQTGLTTTTLPVQIGITRSLANPSTDSDTPVAGASLDWLRFTDANNWYYRIFVSTAAENTPDANGLQRFREIRSKNVAGTTSNWAFNGDYARRDDLHFNGTAWVGCPLGTQNTQTPRDAQGANESWYCNGYSNSRGVRTDVDITGQSIASVVATIRNFPSSYGGTSYTQWGTSSADGADNLVLGNATFPAGSKMRYQSSTTLNSAVGYDVRASNEIFMYSAAITAGGDASNTPSHACNSTEGVGAPTLRVATLEQLSGTFKGVPCAFNPGTVTNNGGTYPSGTPNEWWGQSTLSIGTIGNAPTTGASANAYYTTNALIRVAFTGQGANAVTYYSCKQRIVNGSPRNCTPIGTGTGTIETLGDARVIKLNNPPAQAATLTYNRVFVERGGKVYWGYQDKPGTYQRARLNLGATNALFTQIGLPVVTP